MNAVAVAYLEEILQKYQPRDPLENQIAVALLKKYLTEWAGDCLIGIQESGSRAKGTAISVASDVDYLVSLKSECNENSGGLKSIYESLHKMLAGHYPSVRPQNVSFRISVTGLEIDITPARKHAGNTNDHWLYVSKQNSWKQTNIQKHISDISKSGRLSEIRLAKIWRKLNSLDFPSIYLEYLIVNEILCGKLTDPSRLDDNFMHILRELARDDSNPLAKRIVDPANSNNILSDLLTDADRQAVKRTAKVAIAKQYWREIIY